MGGLRAFTEQAAKLTYGADSPALKGGSLAAIQTLSGTGSCRLFADFMARFMPGAHICIPGAARAADARLRLAVRNGGNNSIVLCQAPRPPQKIEC